MQPAERDDDGDPVQPVPSRHGEGERDPSGFVAESTWLHPRRHGWAAEPPGRFHGHFATRGVSARRIPLRVAAMASRALARTDPRTAEILDDLVREWSRELEKTYDLRWVPVAVQTGLHVRTMLHTARLVCGGS
ncbi:hypothetical protein [Streptomyces canus]|uniref:hypothetical protein n=1 Tax=Streptomyces canus TaxID=58343 RepID=UPI002783EC61|nr:hypothetical protein [Streptomyces canus]MDQ1070511.1 hypothetical protein [Streptomyces canus]